MRSLIVRFAAVPAVAALLVANAAMPALAAPGEFTIVNNTSFAISEIHVGPSASDTWGSTMLDGQVVNPNQTANVSLYNFDGSTCLWDVAIVGTEGQKGVMYRFDVCNLNTVTFSDNN